jgi:hypothetical protein
MTLQKIALDSISTIKFIVASVIPCDIDGELNEMSFVEDFWPLNTIPVEFLQKNSIWWRY